MPIRPENLGRYPADWPAISQRIRFARAAGRCAAMHAMAHPDTGSAVVLTTAHRDHAPENCADGNLFAACQRCHLGYDREHHAETAARPRATALALTMDPLFTEEELTCPT